MDENDRDSIIDQTMCHKNRPTLRSNTINDMATATQIMAMRPLVPYNLLVVQLAGIVVISIVMKVK
jgi:hypothetical protein